jgi:hypothetical protein
MAPLKIAGSALTILSMAALQCSNELFGLAKRLRGSITLVIVQRGNIVVRGMLRIL